MDETRALLDALMGPNRNRKEPVSTDQPDFADDSVCKYFLVGFCPHDWFTMTRRSLTPCTKIHSEIMRSQFEVHQDVQAYRAEYEEEFLHHLEKIAAECTAYIARERTKCRGAGGKMVRMPPEIKARCDEMEKRYATLIKLSEELADESVSRSEAQMKQALALKDELDSIKKQYTSEFAGEDICEVCGVKYPLGDGAHDKESHKRGKTHSGFAQIREKINELRGKKREWDKLRAKIQELREKRKEWEKARAKRLPKVEKERATARSRDRGKGENREASRDRRHRDGRDRESHRDRDRDRDGRRQEAERSERERGDRSASEDSCGRRRGRAERERLRREAERAREREQAAREQTAEERSKERRDSDRSRSRRRAEGERSRPEPQEAEEADAEDMAGIPELWARMERLPPAERAEMVRSLDDGIMDRLEEWLVARVRAKKGPGPGPPEPEPDSD
mmetsp:Transcript_57233/g.123822  ORF Transcript_57233/g.123822 Transcript_57233/m.123822 type:complete len:452 (+) Transcript_57233:174-1529(+)